MQLIESKTLGSAQASIEFTNIPATYTDLLLMISPRMSNAVNWYAMKLEFNSVTTGYSQRILYGDSGTVYSISRSDSYISYVEGANATASTFGNVQVYIPNYALSNNKSFSVDWVNENNSSTNIMGITAGLWSNSATISSIQLIPESGNFASASSATLYGILKGSDGTTTVA